MNSLALERRIQTFVTFVTPGSYSTKRVFKSHMSVVVEIANSVPRLYLLILVPILTSRGQSCLTAHIHHATILQLITLRILPLPSYHWSEILFIHLPDYAILMSTCRNLVNFSYASTGPRPSSFKNSKTSRNSCAHKRIRSTHRQSALSFSTPGHKASMLRRTHDVCRRAHHLAWVNNA